MKNITIDGVEYTLTPVEKKEILQKENYRVDSSEWKVNPYDESTLISPCGGGLEIIKGKYKGEQLFTWHYLEKNKLLEKVPSEEQIEEALENGEIDDLPLAGLRHYSDAAGYNQARYGYLWSSTAYADVARYLFVYASGSAWYTLHRGNGFSVRLLKD